MNDHTTIPEKRCTKCGKYFPATTEYFTRHKAHRDGLYTWCKTCTREKDRARYAANPDRERERSRAWYATNAEYARAKARAWSAANPERLRETNRARRAESPEYYREWAAANRDRGRVYKQNRRARKRNLPNTFTAEEARFALDYFHYSCAYCGRQFHDLFNERTLAFDHFIPLSSPECPGTTAGNMLPVCHGVDGCNLSKGARDPEEWLVSHFGKREARKKLEEIRTYFKTVESV